MNNYLQSKKIRKEGVNAMLNKVWIKRLFVLSTVVFLGFFVPRLASSGMGYGPYSRGGHHPMHAWHHGAQEGPGCGYWGDLSEEDIQKLEKERIDFFEDTKNLRANIYQKRLELRSELAKENPDAKKAAELQSEISKMRAEFDQKRLNHFLNIRKINPDMGKGFGGGYGMMGHGWMHGGRMEPWDMGSRGYGGRYCTNGPYGNFRGGYGMGPGMMGPGYGMGPGMMGPGWGRGENPYWSDRDNPQQSGRHMRPLEEKDAEKIVANYIQSTRNPNLKAGKIEDSGNAFKAQIVTKDNSLVEEVLIDKRSGYMKPAY
jgi:Spy/CpxP family protein refolding chaperone